MSEPRKQETYKHGHYENVGHYEHDVEVYLDSKHALRLVGGRKGDPSAKESWAKHEVIGLVKYAPAAIRLYKMAYGDNPYVDEALLKLEQRIEEADSYLNDKIRYLSEQLTSLPKNTNLRVVRSTNPFHLKPNYGGNPYANKGVIILALYDQMMTLMETCRSACLIKRKQANDLEYHGGRLIRRVFVFPGEFKPCDITRAQYRNNSDSVKKLIDTRGAVSEEVLNRIVVPEFGPIASEVDVVELDEILSALAEVGEPNE